MRTNKCRWSWSVALIGTLVVGCAGQSGSEQKPKASASDESSVRESFQELQSTIKSGDADKLWTLLADKSQADADKIAQSVQTAIAAASAEEKAKLEETLGLPAAELTKLSGKAYLKTKRFRAKFAEVPMSKIDKVTVQDDNATVHFDEPDGDKEKAIFVRQAGQWKVWLVMPKMTPAKSDSK